MEFCNAVFFVPPVCSVVRPAGHHGAHPSAALRAGSGHSAGLNPSNQPYPCLDSPCPIIQTNELPPTPAWGGNPRPER
jgi:hypothetical protein